MLSIPTNVPYPLLVSGVGGCLVLFGLVMLFKICRTDMSAPLALFDVAGETSCWISYRAKEQFPSGSAYGLPIGVWLTK